MRRPNRLPFLPLVVLLVGPALRPLPVAAAETAVVQEILDGNELYIDGKTAKVKETATAPQKLSTENSRGQIRFDSGAAGRLNRFSQLKLGQGCFLIDKGQILVSGKQSGCTRSARLSVRGTNYLVDVNETGEAEISVLEGSVEVEPLADGEPTGQPVTTVEAGQKLRLSAKGVVMALLGLSAGDYTSILSGPLFRGFRVPLPAYGSLEGYIRSKLPGVSLPAPIPTPSLPFGLPRFF
ncbi:MAG: iron dicitrate transport regulator FecR [Cyanobium sp. CACIAM 14]|nr:MAG: iron dicitrate transport regulator FecR [Cyanobium sp. CACIAM 14]